MIGAKNEQLTFGCLRHSMMYIFHLDIHLYSCICMYHTHSDAVCFWAVILLYTLYLDDIMTVVTMYIIYVIWMYVCIGCSMMTLNFTLCTCIITQLGVFFIANK